jgi:hypothetical protein
MTDYSDYHEEMFMCLKLLKIAKKRHGKGYGEEFSKLTSEDIFEVYMSVLDSMDELEKYGYDDNYQVTTYRFVSKAMTEYFHLAHKYGERHNISIEQNPYIGNAISHLNNTIGSIRSYCCNYKLYHSKTRKSRLYFLTDNEYWMPMETIEELYSFFDYFPVKLPALRAELKKCKRRKAA